MNLEIELNLFFKEDRVENRYWYFNCTWRHDKELYVSYAYGKGIEIGRKNYVG